MEGARIDRRRAVVLTLAVVGLVLAVIAARGTGPESAFAASHREAPLIALDGPADISDFFMFRSYEPGKQDKVVLVANVNPGAEPSSGPNYYNFDPSVTYAFNVDNDRDGRADDVSFDFKFRTEIRGPVDALDLLLSYLGGARAVRTDHGRSTGRLGRPRPAAALRRDDDRGDHRTRIARDLIAVPSNVGPKTMPNYDALAKQGIHALDARHQGLRRTAAGPVLHRPRRRVRHVELPPGRAALTARRTRTTTEPVRRRHALRVQRLTIAIEVPLMMTAARTSDRRLCEHGRPRAPVADRLGLGVEVTVTRSHRSSAWPTR